jgi:hypothetical protein
MLQSKLWVKIVVLGIFFAAVLICVILGCQVLIQENITHAGIATLIVNISFF